MISNKTIGVVVPCYQEELLIGKTLSTMPEFVDHIVIINDGSTDNTANILKEFEEKDNRICVITHEKNQGLGQSLIDGYLKAIAMKIDVVAVMAGDAQMAPDDLINVVTPIILGNTDYVKGNRLLRDDAFKIMPKHRYFGNSILTLLTKFATGYWHVIDPQCGYTAISRKALESIVITNMTKGYGYNADILNMLNLNNFRVLDVEVKPVYQNEQSKIKLINYIPKVSLLLLRLFIKRLVHKYLVREFHPLILFYVFCLGSFLVTGLPMLIRSCYVWAATGDLPPLAVTIFLFSTNISVLAFFFGMWLDMEDNKQLKGKKVSN